MSEIVKMEKEIFVVWIDIERRIASFHEIENSEKMEFEQHAEFMEFLNNLSRNNYRFQ